jgi:lipopolysaccharide export system protein LptA
MISRFFFPALVLSVLFLPQQNALAQQAPVDIEANEMEIIDADKRAIFRGQVDATRNGDHIKSDEMIVDYSEVKQADGTSKSQVSRLDANGHVTITTGKQVITGNWAKLDVLTDKLEVGGDVKLVEGKTILRGPKLFVELKTKRIVMSGGRVKGSFVPK